MNRMLGIVHSGPPGHRRLRGLGVLLALLCCAASAAHAISITRYIAAGTSGMQADIRWGPAASTNPIASAEIVGEDVGGVAFIDVFDCGGFIHCHVAATDTNGQYGPDAIDWLDLLINTSRPYAGPHPDITNTRWYGGYRITALADTAWGITLSAGSLRLPADPVGVPDAAATLWLLAPAIALAAVGRRRLSARSRT